MPRSGRAALRPETASRTKPPAAPGAPQKPPRAARVEPPRGSGVPVRSTRALPQASASPLRPASQQTMLRFQWRSPQTRRSWLLPSLACPFDLGFQRVEVLVIPRSLAHERGHHLSERTAEERVQVLLKRRALGDGRRHRGGIDVTEAVLLMAQEPLPLEPGEHDAHRRIARRRRQLRADVFGGRAILEGKDRVHDFPLASGQALRGRLWHMRQLSHNRRDTCRMSTGGGHRQCRSPSGCPAIPRLPHLDVVYYYIVDLNTW